jgi:hypothetical protein
MKCGRTGCECTTCMECGRRHENCICDLKARTKKALESEDTHPNDMIDLLEEWSES